MKCRRCENELTGYQKAYCSFRCGKLHLKSLYRKRNRAKVAAYNRAYRAKGVRPLTGKRRRRARAMLGKRCARCGCKGRLDIHHWIPARSGGTNALSNLVLLCSPCHQALHVRIKGYWP